MSITVYNIALVAHVIGITIMAGTTFIDFITFKVFRKAYQADRQRGLVYENYLFGLQRFMGIGMLVILLSGVTMMIKLHEIWGAQVWFRIKIVVLLFIIINGLGLRRVIGRKLRTAVANNTEGDQLDDIKRRFTWVQSIQMLLFVIIYVLSVFKFN